MKGGFNFRRWKKGSSCASCWHVSGLPTPRLESYILDNLLYCRLSHDFLLYMLQTTTFSHSITKQPASILEFQYFYSILRKKILLAQTKKEKSAISCVWAGNWPALMCTLTISRSSQTFFSHIVDNPGMFDVRIM